MFQKCVHHVRYYSATQIKVRKSVLVWEKKPNPNTSIIIIFDTNANPTIMFAICGLRAGAEITEQNRHK